jgi:putative membrane protein
MATGTKAAESVLSAPPQTRVQPFHWTLLTIFFAVLLWSGIRPFDRFTWFLEVVPALIGLPILVFTYRRFPFTRLVYILILMHAIVLMVGGHFTYAREPFFEWLKQVMHWPRNNYDKLGHFMQGFVPAMVAREVLLRKTPLRRGSLLFFLVVCVCGAISASYELFEWLMAVVSGGKADDFLGTQGYEWDTQTDMLMAFIGAIVAQVVLSRLHDRQLERMGLSN